MKFSVIIATKDRPESLQLCLESFREMEYPAGDWELILVNDGGATTYAGVTPAQKVALPLTLLNAPQSGGPGSARNLGARAARGEYLAFTDDDCRVAPDWLSQYELLLSTGGWDAAGGLSLNPFPGNQASEAWNYLVAFLYKYWHDDRGNVVMIVSNNAAVRRDVFLTLGGFDESFVTAASEDREFSYRLLANGYRQTFCPEARVWHHQLNPTTWNYIRTQFRYGRGGAYFLEKIEEKSIKDAVRIEPQGHPVYPIALWKAMIDERKSLKLILLITIGQVAHRLGRIYETTRRKTRSSSRE